MSPVLGSSPHSRLQIARCASAAVSGSTPSRSRSRPRTWCTITALCTVTVGPSSAMNSSFAMAVRKRLKNRPKRHASAGGDRESTGQLVVRRLFLRLSLFGHFGVGGDLAAFEAKVGVVGGDVVDRLGQLAELGVDRCQDDFDVGAGDAWRCQVVVGTEVRGSA